MLVRPSITAFCISLLLPLAQGAEEAADTAPKLRKIPAISVLPDGSELHGVVLPRYDDKLRLTGSLHAEKLTLVSSEIVRGDRVRITLIDPDRADGDIRIALGTAVLDQSSGMIRAKEKIVMESALFTATGSALHFDFEAGRGFVSGPATTVIQPPKKTAMHKPATLHHPTLATAALGVVIATAAIVDARPPAVSEAELSELREASASSAGRIGTLAEEARTEVATARESSDRFSAAARTFLINQVIEPGEVPPAAPEHPDAKPLEVEDAPDDIRIVCDGGFFFDAEEGVLVYLENVRVTDPRFTLNGVDELKVIFAKKPAPEEKAEPEKPGEKPEAAPAEDDKEAQEPEDPAKAFAANIGDVERIIATGRVLFTQRQPAEGEAPVEASGALLNYNVASGEVILSGGFPWVRRGGFFSRALEPNLNLRIRRDGSFVTEGTWEQGIPIPR